MSSLQAATGPTILFITSNSLGDAVLSTGILGWVLDENPTAHLTVVSGPMPAPLFSMIPQAETVIPLRKQKHSQHWLGLWRQLHRQKWDLIIDLRNTIVSRLLRARRRVIFKGSPEPIHKNLQLAKLFNLSSAPMPRLWLTPTIQSEAVAIFAGSNAPILALAPAANWPGKQWPAERFAALALVLTAEQGPLPGGRIAIFAAAHERAMLQPLYEALAHAQLPPHRIIDLAGRTDTALAAACLAQSTLFIGNDSGLMHTAAALGIRTLGLFGPSDEKIDGPCGPRTAWIRTPESLAELNAMKNQPCLMLSLSLKNVKAAAIKLVNTAEFPAS